MTTSDVSPAAVGGGTCPVSHRAASFNPFVEPYLSDPYSFLAGVRAEEPVFYSPEIDYYVVTKFDDVRMVFRDPRTFSAEIALEPLTPLFPSSIQKVIDVGYVPGGPVLVNEDGPIHMKRRKASARSSRPSALRRSSRASGRSSPSTSTSSSLPAVPI